MLADRRAVARRPCRCPRAGRSTPPISSTNGCAGPTPRLRWPMSWAPSWCWLRAGAVPPTEDQPRHEVFRRALRELGRRADHHGTRLALETGTEPGAEAEGVSRRTRRPGLAASIDPAACCTRASTRSCACASSASWVVHAYLNDATGAAGVSALNPRGFGLSSRRARLGGVPGRTRRDRLPGLSDRLARAGPAGRDPVCRRLRLGSSRLP